MSDRYDVDIAIVGGGMIGASLALALQHLPLRVAVIEAIAPDIRLDKDFDARSLSLSPASQRIFSAMGLWKTLRAHVLPIEHIHVSDKGHFWANRFHADDEAMPSLGYMIEVSDLQRELNQHCQKIKNIHWYCPAKLESLTSDGSGANLQINVAGELQSLRCRLVIAADGHHSKVRQLKKIENEQWDYGQTAIAANIGLARSHHNTAYERFTAQGPMAMLPLTRQRSALVWTVPHAEIEYYQQLSDSAFLAALQKHFGYRLGRFVKVGKRGAFPLKLVLAANNTAQSMVLIGNAAQTIHPVAGQGFNLGLRDVATLATVLNECLEQNEDIGNEAMLKRYDAQRKRDRQQIVALTDGLTRLYSNRYLPHSLLRTLCMFGVDVLSPAKQLLLQHSMGLAGPLPDLACGLLLGMENDTETV